MFYHAFDGYMEHAFPLDELRPLSCGGEDSLGGYALTLVRQKSLFLNLIFTSHYNSHFCVTGYNAIFPDRLFRYAGVTW